MGEAVVVDAIAVEDGAVVEVAIVDKIAVVEAMVVEVVVTFRLVMVCGVVVRVAVVMLLTGTTSVGFHENKEKHETSCIWICAVHSFFIYSQFAWRA